MLVGATGGNVGVAISSDGMRVVFTVVRGIILGIVVGVVVGLEISSSCDNMFSFCSKYLRRFFNLWAFSYIALTLSSSA